MINNNTKGSNNMDNFGNTLYKMECCKCGVEVGGTSYYYAKDEKNKFLCCECYSKLKQ